MTDFASLGLSAPLLSALNAQKFNTPTPIQAGTIPAILAGEDVLGIAQTGTGKTAAFGLPVLQKLAGYQGHPDRKTATAIILAPTRELAGQIADSLRPFAKRLRLSLTAVFGGVGKGPQIRDLSRGVDLLIATPGRLRDLMEMRAVTLAQTEILILDEADRMLDMGFAPEVKRLAAEMPSARQTVLFSATMPKDIKALANTLMSNPTEVSVAPESTPVDRIDQSVRFLERARKLPALRKIVEDIDRPRIIAFTRTKRGADKVAKGLKADGIRVAAIHGDKSQAARQRALADFAKGRIGVLVATDLAARGIDVDHVSHVINYDVSVDPESHVHRIGRTARNGATGTAITFCAPDELEALQAIEKITRLTIRVDEDHPDHLPDIAAQAAVAPKPARRRPGGKPNGRNGAKSGAKPSRGRHRGKPRSGRGQEHGDSNGQAQGRGEERRQEQGKSPANNNANDANNKGHNNASKNRRSKPRRPKPKNQRSDGGTQKAA